MQISKIMAILVLVCGIPHGAWAFEANQSLESIKQEIKQKYAAHVASTKIYQSAKITGVSKELMASLMLLDAPSKEEAIQALFLSDVPVKTTAKIAKSLGISNDVILRVALNSGINIDDLFESTAAGVSSEGSSYNMIGRASFSGTPASSFTGGGGSAASRN